MNKNRELFDRTTQMMKEIKAYATTLEEDLSLLNKFYNGKKAWPENILKIRQSIYKKRHAQVAFNKKKKASFKEYEKDKIIRRDDIEEETEESLTTEEDRLYLNPDIFKTDQDEKTWCVLALGE